MAIYRIKRFGIVFVIIVIFYLVIIHLYGISYYNTGNIKRFQQVVSNSNKMYTEYDHLRIVSNCLPRSDYMAVYKYHLSPVVGHESIILYGPGSWDIITKSIKKRGYFEPAVDNVIYFYMRTNPSAIFLDIGGNIGIRSLQVANYNREAIAIEALRQNLVYFCQSMHTNGVADKITLVHNAIGEDHRHIKMAKGNRSMGCSFVLRDKDNNEAADNKDVVLEEEIPTITFDDLLHLDKITTAKQVFIKMDIEGYEAHALQEADMFFRRIDVIGVEMEWRWHRGKESGGVIRSFMKRFGFIPFKFNSAGNKFTMLREGQKWPHDMLWLSWRYVKQIHV